MAKRFRKNFWIFNDKRFLIKYIKWPIIHPIYLISFIDTYFFLNLSNKIILAAIIGLVDAIIIACSTSVITGVVGESVAVFGQPDLDAVVIVKPIIAASWTVGVITAIEVDQ